MHKVRGKLFILATALTTTLTLVALGGAEARPGGGHPPPHHAPPPHHHPPPPPPQGWAKVGKHVYTTATWHGGQRGAWSTDVPF